MLYGSSPGGAGGSPAVWIMDANGGGQRRAGNTAIPGRVRRPRRRASGSRLDALSPLKHTTRAVPAESGPICSTRYARAASVAESNAAGAHGAGGGLSMARELPTYQRGVPCDVVLR